MQSPPLEWTLAIGHLAVLDYIRSRGDADQDTLSEVVRGYVDSHKAGRAIFTTAYTLGAVALWRHICKQGAPQ